MKEEKRMTPRRRASGNTVVPFIYQEAQAQKKPDAPASKVPEEAHLEEPPILGVEYTLEDALAYRDEIPELFDFIGGEDAEITEHFLQAFDEQVLSGQLMTFERLEAFFEMVRATAGHIRNYLEYNTYFYDNRLPELNFDSFIRGFPKEQQADFAKLFPQYFEGAQKKKTQEEHKDSKGA